MTGKQNLSAVTLGSNPMLEALLEMAIGTGSSVRGDTFPRSLLEGIERYKSALQQISKLGKS